MINLKFFSSSTGENINHTDKVTSEQSSSGDRITAQIKPGATWHVNICQQQGVPPSPCGQLNSQLAGAQQMLLRRAAALNNHWPNLQACLI
jgi:hypothetical protein